MMASERGAGRGPISSILSLACGILVGCSAESRFMFFPEPYYILAHRCASAYAPENTLPACQKAISLGADAVEIDVQLSSDSKVILFHDAVLDTKTDHRGRVADYSLQALEEVEIGSWFDRTHPEVEEKFAGTRLVSLDALFAQLGDRLAYHVELKSEAPALPERVLASIRKAGLEHKVTMTSFLFDQLERTRELASELPIAYLIGRSGKQRGVMGKPLAGAALLDFQKGWIDRSVEAGFSMVGVASEDLSHEVVAYARERGLEIRAWRIRGDADMDRAISFGVNGMTTNWPDRLMARRRDYQAGVWPAK